MDAQHRDQERVDLHVETRAERRSRCRCAARPRHPSTALPETERDHGADRDRRTPRSPASAAPTRPGPAVSTGDRAGEPASAPAARGGVEPGRATATSPADLNPIHRSLRVLGVSPAATAIGTVLSSTVRGRRPDVVRRRRSRSGWSSRAGARSARSRCPEPRRRRGAGARAALRHQPRHRVAGVRAAGCRPAEYATMRAPFQEGDFPGPVKYGYLSVGVVEHGPADLRRPHRLLPPPAPDGVRRPGHRRRAGARRRAGRARRPRRHRRDRRQRAVGRRAAGRRPGRGRRRRHGRLLRGPAAGRHPRRAGDARRRRPDARRRSRRRWASGSPPRPTRPTAATSSCTPAPPRPGCSRSLELLGPEGTVLDLSWYGDRPVTLPLGGAFHSVAAHHPGQPGRRRRAGSAGPPDPPRPADPGAGAAARPGLRRAAHRVLAVRGAARGDGRRSPTGRPARRCATRSATTDRDDEEA